jgi:pyruvate/2-oxoglutarate dehydrogenase complex dihydrolipoamide dehydrogenase (E3) component
MTREQRKFDAVVIGTGQSGPSLAVDLAKAGQRVAIVERHLFGGTCVNTGCIPTKTLIANARVAHMVRRARDYGVVIDSEVRMDMKAVKARKDEVAGLSKTGVENMLRTTENCSVYTGHARFVSDHEVQVGDVLLTAEKIFINVGGRAATPRIDGLDGVTWLTNSSMMDVDYLPEHLIIVGGSYVGLEFAQMFRRFGSKVTVLQRGPRLIPREDADVSESLREILQKEQISIRLNTDCLAVKKSGRGLEVRARCGSGDTAIQGSHLLIATGRRPNTDDLGVENTHIQCDEHGYIQVDEQLRTAAPGVWAVGDCNGRGAFTHTSYNDYEIVAGNLLRNESRRVTDRITTYALFTDPPLGRAGMTEADVRKSGRKALIGTRPMTRVGRAVEKGETDGFIKILVDAESKLILGASILGTDGDEAIHCILDVMYARAPYQVLQRAVHIHPTVSELLPTVMGDLKPLE